MYRVTRDVTISSSTSLSSAVEDLKGYRLAAIQMPNAWTSANLTFQAQAKQGGEYENLYDSDGNELTVTADKERYIQLGEQDVEELVGVWGLKVRSGTSSAAVNQGSDRTLTLVLVKG